MKIWKWEGRLLFIPRGYRAWRKPSEYKGTILLWVERSFTLVIYLFLPSYEKFETCYYYWHRERELQTSPTSKRRAPLRRGKVSQRLPVPDHIPKPPYVGSRILPDISKEHQIHDEEGLARLKAACELAARVVDYAGTLIRVRICELLCNLVWDIDIFALELLL